MERRKNRHQSMRVPFIIFFLLLFVAAIIGAIFWFCKSQRSLNRMTVVLASDPATVLSFDRRDKTFILVSMPASTVIEGVSGYGQYSLESLWKLGTMEGKEGTVLAQSMEELLGVPVSWYIGGKNHALLDGTKGPLALVKKTFSLSRLFSFIGNRTFASNISPISFWTIAWALANSRPDNMREVDLTHSLVAQTLADGTQIFVADPNSIDGAIGALFEDKQIRKEALSVYVLNTTPTPTIGTRVGRLLGHLGVLVIGVGNDRPTEKDCVIQGGKKELESATAALITSLFLCKPQENISGRSDLTVRVGTAYQKRFEP